MCWWGFRGLGGGWLGDEHLPSAVCQMWELRCLAGVSAGLSLWFPLMPSTTAVWEVWRCPWHTSETEPRGVRAMGRRGKNGTGDPTFLQRLVEKKMDEGSRLQLTFKKNKMLKIVHKALFLKRSLSVMPVGLLVPVRTPELPAANSSGHGSPRSRAERDRPRTLPAVPERRCRGSGCPGRGGSSGSDTAGRGSGGSGHGSAAGVSERHRHRHRAPARPAGGGRGAGRRLRGGGCGSGKAGLGLGTARLGLLRARSPMGSPPSWRWDVPTGAAGVQGARCPGCSPRCCRRRMHEVVRNGLTGAANPHPSRR